MFLPQYKVIQNTYFIYIKKVYITTYILIKNDKFIYIYIYTLLVSLIFLFKTYSLVSDTIRVYVYCGIINDTIGVLCTLLWYY